MTRTVDIQTIVDPVDRAAAANNLLWDGHPDSQDIRMTRGLAIREAVEQGRALRDIADHLGVRVDDLGWMSRRSGL